MVLKFKKTFLAMALATGMGAAYAKLPEGVEKVTSVEGITEYRLDNGLQVLLFPDPTQETVTVNVTYHVGSKHENYGETGMAHLLEHLVFKGTPDHKDIPKELTDHGAEPNGTTWYDRTNYFETFSATPENIEWALDLEADRMINSFIAKKDLDSEMTVVRNELENGENSPFRVLMQRLMSTAFDWHNYGKSTIGARSDLENVDISNLQAFYRKYYQPDNATLIVSGKIDEEQLIELIDEEFGDIPKPDRTIAELYTEEPIQDGERRVVVRRPGDVQMVGVLYKTPAGPSEKFAAVQVLNQILGDNKTGRLHDALVKNELAASTFGFPFQLGEPGALLFGAQVAKGKDIAKTESEMLKTLEDIKSNPITEKEVKQAKAKLLKQIELSFNSSQSIALELTEWVGMGDWRLLFLNRDRLEAVTVDDVQAAAEEFLVNDNRTLGLFLPEQKPDRADSIVRMSDEEIDAMLEGYEGRKAVAQGEDFDPSHDNIDERTVESTLSNGAKVVYLPKKTRGESVVAQIRLDIGNLNDLRNSGVIPSLTAGMLDRGTKDLSREELQSEFDRLKANVSVSGDSTTVTARIQTNKENLAEVIRLVEQVLKNPRFSEEELEVLKRERIVSLEQQKQQPSTQVFMQLGRHLNPYDSSHPFYSMSIDEQIEAIKKVTPEQLASFHDSFMGAQDADIALVGDFNKDEMQELLEETLGNWKSEVEYERIKTSASDVESINKFVDTPDKAGAAFGAMTQIPVSDEHPDHPALIVANQIFGGGFLNSRLATRLRQKDGLSYGAGSFLRVSSQDDKAIFGAYAICAPENLAKVEQGFKEEFEKVIEQGFTKDELDAAVKGMIQNRRIDRAKDNRLVGTLASNLDLDRSMQWDEEFEQALKTLTVEDINQAFRKHLSLDNISIVKAGDKTKAE
ncbi:M16 family metallopeptidase [Kangiella sediminilitoris]|uniref:Peptidase M16 domain protein n=1 Tax=Kangiella sediminilitoris TaxID=1144748 RepID=A0A1B3BA31_9GAMM|nr:pitrilysin family protein [Kangiella sediminilitoris]AOE49672.1 Peptidase M16 domain protein [Kangiella sediminilitoris]